MNKTGGSGYDRESKHCSGGLPHGDALSDHRQGGRGHRVLQKSFGGGRAGPDAPPRWPGKGFFISKVFFRALRAFHSCERKKSFKTFSMDMTSMGNWIMFGGLTI